jgi:hypothetical protein
LTRWRRFSARECNGRGAPCVAALDVIRKEAKKLYENGKPVADLAKALKR